MAGRYGRNYTDAQIRHISARLRRLYKQAESDLNEKISDYWKRHRERDRKYRQKVANGEMSEANYKAWLQGQVFQGNQWFAKRSQIVREMVNADNAAHKIVDGQKQNVFNQNANFVGYDIENNLGIDIGFELFDSSTVARLVEDDPALLPALSPKKVAEGKAIPYYQNIVTNAITQGILQGEGVEEISRRITKTCTERAESAAIRDARTAYTGAQNAGRIAGMKESQKLGINVRKRWIATFDFRTRDAHRTLDGQVVDVDKPFKVDGDEIEYPGDPKAKAYLVYNCRCTLGWIYPEYEQNVERRDNITGETVGDMTYREWYNKKKNMVGAKDANRNTYTEVFYDENASYEVNVNGYSKKVNAGLSKAIKSVARKGTDTHYEHMYLVNLETGALEHYETNEEYGSVGYEFRDHIRNHPEGRYAFVHNHNTDSSFSETDMVTLLTVKQIPMMVAVRNDGVVYIANRKGEPLKTGFFDSLYEEDLKPLREALQSGKISVAERTRRRELLLVDNVLRDYTKEGRLVEYDTRKHK